VVVEAIEVEVDQVDKRERSTKYEIRNTSPSYFLPLTSDPIEITEINKNGNQDSIDTEP
jgi:hypothetical protein